MHFFAKLELGDFFIMLGRSVEEAEVEEEEQAPATLAHTNYPMTEYAERPGFRLIGPEHAWSTDN